MEKQTIIQYTDDETVIQFRWNHSLTVNVYEGARQYGYENENIVFAEVDVFTFADDTSYDEMVGICDEYVEDWMGEVLSNERPDGTRF